MILAARSLANAWQRFCLVHRRAAESDVRPSARAKEWNNLEPSMYPTFFSASSLMSSQVESSAKAINEDPFLHNENRLRFVESAGEEGRDLVAVIFHSFGPEISPHRFQPQASTSSTGRMIT